MTPEPSRHLADCDKRNATLPFSRACLFPYPKCHFGPSFNPRLSHSPATKGLMPGIEQYSTLSSDWCPCFLECYPSPPHWFRTTDSFVAQMGKLRPTEGQGLQPSPCRQSDRSGVIFASLPALSTQLILGRQMLCKNLLSPQAFPSPVQHPSTC